MPMMVVFPAPLGPRSAKKSPAGTVSETPFRASVPLAYLFMRSFTTSAGSDMGGDYTKLMSGCIPIFVYARICCKLLLEKPLNRIERFLRLSLEAEDERGRIRRGADEAPPVVDVDAGAVHIDNLITFFLERGDEFVDDTVFILIGGFHLDGRRRDVIRGFCYEFGNALFLRRDVFQEFQSREECVVKAVVILIEKDVSTHFARKRGFFFGEFRFDVRMARLPHDGDSAVCVDVFRQRFGYFHIEDDFRPRFLRKDEA